MLFLLSIVNPGADSDVSIFDNLNTILHQLGEFFAQIINGLRFLPTLITDCGQLVNRYQTMFPSFLFFIVAFLFGGGIICKLLHWGD